MLSLAPIAQQVAAELGRPVNFITESAGAKAEEKVAALAPGAIAMLENLRFHPESKRRSRVFALLLSAIGDFFADLGATPRHGDGWQQHLMQMLPAPQHDAETQR